MDELSIPESITILISLDAVSFFYGEIEFPVSLREVAKTVARDFLKSKVEKDQELDFSIFLERSTLRDREKWNQVKEWFEFIRFGSHGEHNEIDLWNYAFVKIRNLKLCPWPESDELKNLIRRYERNISHRFFLTQKLNEVYRIPQTEWDKSIYQKYGFEYESGLDLMDTVFLMSANIQLKRFWVNHVRTLSCDSKKELYRLGCELINRSGFSMSLEPVDSISEYQYYWPDFD